MSQHSWRLFFALWPDPLSATATYEAAGALCAVPPARRIGANRLHMTLQFLGSQSPEALAEISEAAKCVKAPPFELLLDRSGYWKRAGVAWLAPSEAPAALLDLVADLRRALQGIGMPAEARPFRPHVTIARKARSAPIGPLEEALRWQLAHFRLVRSATHPGGAEYTEIARWRLAG